MRAKGAAAPVWRVLSGWSLVMCAACAGASTADLSEGRSGLAGALPGGDGRQLAAYRAEFRANAIGGMDSLLIRLEEVWRRDRRETLAGLYSPDATLVTPDGSLLVGGARIREWVEHELPRTAMLDTWRDDFAASGAMTVMYGRYEADAVDGRGDHRGVHITVAKRDRLDWRIRAAVYLSFEGAPPPAPNPLRTPDPPHVQPDSLRAKYGRRALKGHDPRAEWIVDTYFMDNQFLSAFRYAWDRDDPEAIFQLLAPDVVLRLPFDIPAVGRTNAGYSLQRLLPAVGSLRMSILDFDMSERLSFVLGSYAMEATREEVRGYYLAVVRLEDHGPLLKALLFSGAGANVVPRAASQGAR